MGEIRFMEDPSLVSNVCPFWTNIPVFIRRGQLYFQRAAGRGEAMPLTKGQKELANRLLQAASERLKSVPGDVPAFNLLTVLQADHYETKTHSRIISRLLNDQSGQDAPNRFLLLFLRVLRIPRKFLSETWRVAREQAFGPGRVDFIMESRSCCVIVEMKIDAGDGERQLERYETIGRGKRKEYLIYYLTLDGHRPEDQSAGGIDADRLRCISFRKEIILWLQECMKCVEESGYQYSFLKQYLGAVRHITDTDDGGMDVGVKDLLDTSDMAKAAQLVAKGFYEKMDDVTTRFFQKLDGMIRRKTKLETDLYANNKLDVYLKDFTHRRHPYCVKLFVEIDTYLIVGVAFSEVAEDDIITLRLDEAERIFPSIYREWMGKLDALAGVPRFRHWPRSKYFELEDSRGAKLNFKDYSAQIALIDEMDRQCRYIGGYIINRLIKPLLED